MACRAADAPIGPLALGPWVAVNHFKSKVVGLRRRRRPRPLDGQGNCSQTPKLAAQALPDRLVTDPTGSGDRDFLIMGDLNSYAMEASIEAIKGQTKAPGVVSGGRFMHECW